MRSAFIGVQRIVLHGTPWQVAGHLMLTYHGRTPLPFLNSLARENTLSFVRDKKYDNPAVQYSLGFTRRGLKLAQVPDRVLACFALKSPAYCAGAALRAAAHLGLTDDSAPRTWDPPFEFKYLDAVLSVHAMERGVLVEAAARLSAMALGSGLDFRWLPFAAALPPPPDVEVLESRSHPDRRPQWVHFGFRDSVSRIGIEGWTKNHAIKALKPTSTHKAGEFVFGHAQDSGANPWVAGPGLMVWPEELRRFFHNGSFGVLQQIEQDVEAFERFVTEKAVKTHLKSEEIKGKLCGRFPDGRPLANPNATDPMEDFDYTEDRNGYQCPFGSHVRRMNPRVAPDDSADPKDCAKEKALEKPKAQSEPLAHFSRRRPLLRRGLPYGASAALDSSEKRGLLAQFFCASIEDQYEHLLGEWADRVPLGSPDRGGARDPLIGAHTRGDGPFLFPLDPHKSISLDCLQAFTRTRGVAYLFYPSESTLRGIAMGSLWGVGDKDDDA